MFPRPNTNRDGSINIFCPICHNSVGSISHETAMAVGSFHTAKCVVCQAQERGEILPDHVIAQLRSGTLEVQYTDQSYDPVLERHLDDKESSTNDPNWWFRTVTVAGTRIKRAVAALLDNTPSKEVAVSKKRKRIFDGPIDE